MQTNPLGIRVGMDVWLVGMPIVFSGVTKYYAMHKYNTTFSTELAAQTINCLLIDDDIDEAEIFQMALRRTGLPTKFTIKTNGLDVIDQLSDPEIPAPDIIFLDLNMPVINGKECLRKFRSNARLKTVPVVIYSTSTDLAEIRETKALGASHYLAKTSAVADLAEMLQHLFYRKNLPYWLNLTLDHSEI